MKRIITFLLFFCVTSALHAQSFINDFGKKEKKWFVESSQESRAKNYKKAHKLLDKILKKHPDCVDVFLRKGSFLMQQERPDEARAQFEKAIALAPEYDYRAYFVLGKLLCSQQKYKEAGKNLSIFLASGKGKKKRVAQAKGYLKICDFASEAIENPVPFDPVRLSEGINNEKLQYLPALAADGEALLYTQREGGFEELYISQIKDGAFETGVPFLDVNLPQGEAAHCISPDGRTIYVTSNDRNLGFGSCDLFFSVYRNGKWSQPANMGPRINSTTWDSQPSISADGNTLYFSSKRRLGYGESDLYSVSKDKEGKWMVPVNLGGVINTAGSDESPFIHPDNNTLYFRSKGHPGMGNFDIFMSRRDLNTGEWQEPVNLGYPINTFANDGALFVSIDGEKAYYTSDRYSRENNLKPNLDIYTFDLHSEARPTPVSYVKGTIIDAITKERIECDINITSFSTESTAQTDGSGQFLVTLPSNEDYAFAVKKQGYIFHSKRFELKGIASAMKPAHITIELLPIPKKEASPTDEMVYDKPIVLNNILFASGSSDLLVESDQEIQNLYDILTENSGVKIKIIGHTDNVGRPSDNALLSEKRAEAVRKALIDKGIGMDRLQFEGKGETEPIASNETEEGRKTNRRTTFILLRD